LWAEVLTEANISIKELIPVVLAVATWNHCWSGKSIRVSSYNMAAVMAINSHSSRDPGIGHLLLSYSGCIFSVSFARHSAGACNTSGWHYLAMSYFFVSLSTPTGKSDSRTRPTASTTARTAELDIVLLDNAAERQDTYAELYDQKMVYYILALYLLLNHYFVSFIVFSQNGIL